MPIAFRVSFFFFQAEDGIRDLIVTGVQTCALPISLCALLDDPAHAREQVLAWLESPGTTLLVAQSEAGVLGVAVLVTRIVPLAGGLTHKVVEVDNLVVRADRRGQRIGRRLLAAVVEWARQRRAVQVEAVVGEGDGRRFYQSFGFAAANDRLVLAS